MKKLFILLLIAISTLSYGQQSINILCADFTLNEKPFEKGKDLRRVFESVLSNLENPPTLIEREKLAVLLERIQEEKNLAKDFDAGSLAKLQTANVDFLIVGGFSKSLVSASYEFHAECIKISGQNVLSKTVFTTLRFKEDELINTSFFEKEVKMMLEKYSFIQGFGILEYQQYKEIVRRLDEKDKELIELKRSVQDMMPEKRELSEIQILSIAKVLERFKGKEFQIWIPNNDYEIGKTTRQLDAVLQKAGWVNTGITTMMSYNIPPGIHFLVNEVTESDEAIVLAFKTYTSLTVIATKEQKDINGLVIAVGPSPQGNEKK